MLGKRQLSHNPACNIHLLLVLKIQHVVGKIQHAYNLCRFNYVPSIDESDLHQILCLK